MGWGAVQTFDPIGVVPAKRKNGFKLRFQKDRLLNGMEDFEAAFRALPAAKRGLVQAMKEEYWQKSDALKEKYQNGSHEEYVEAYRQLNAEHEKELAAALTERELEEFLIRTSVTGSSLASKLAEFGPSEEEFRGIFRLTRKF